MRLRSTSKNALKIPIASTLMTAMPAELPTNTLMMEPTINTMAPMNSHLAKPSRSRLTMVLRLAMMKNTAAVPPKAVMMRSEPFLKPSTMASKRESMRPMKKVKASKTGTPAAESLVFWMANIKPMAPPKKTMRPKPPPKEAVMPVLTPTHAPNTVGIMLRASSQ